MEEFAHLNRNSNKTKLCNLLTSWHLLFDVSAVTPSCFLVQLAWYCTHQSYVCQASFADWCKTSLISRSRAKAVQCELQSGEWSCGLSRGIWWGETPHKRLSLILLVYVVQLLCLQLPLVDTAARCQGHRLNSLCTLTLPTAIHCVACRAIITTLWMFHRLNTLVWLTLNGIWQTGRLSILWQILN